MDNLIAFALSHKTLLALAVAPLGWLYSAAMSTMPPLKPDAGWWTTWAYKFAQATAANFHKQQQDPLNR